MQGSSQITTVKEVQIGGIVKMRLLQRKYKRFIKEIRVYDIFCGDGQNMVGGEILRGSPLEIAQAISSTGVKNCEMFASDISENSIKKLKPLLKKYENVVSHAYAMPAKNALQDVIKWISANDRRHAIVVVDPNGPGEFPHEELMLFKQFNKRADVIINISETAINRILACSITKNKNWWKGYNCFCHILWAIKGCEPKTSYKGAWIRLRSPGDKQRWRLVAFFSYALPRNNWRKQSLYEFTTYNEMCELLKK